MALIITGKSNSENIQDKVTLVSCEYAHWTLMAQIRSAPGNGGSTSHKCYPVLELSGYLSWTISSIKMGSWSSWRKTLVNWIWSLVGSIIRWSFSFDYVRQLYTLDQYHQGNTGWTLWEIGELFETLWLIFFLNLMVIFELDSEVHHAKERLACWFDDNGEREFLWSIIRWVFSCGKCLIYKVSLFSSPGDFVENFIF